MITVYPVHKMSDFVYFPRSSNLNKHLIINFHLPWVEGLTSRPDIIITIWTTVRIAIKVRVIIGSCIICNVDIMTYSKGWTIVIEAVCGILIVAVHVIFKVTISVIVFQRVYEGVGRVLIPIRP